MRQLSSDLIDQAVFLARRDPTGPRSANLRRAVSTAYYALFHHLIEDSAKLLAGSPDGDGQLVALVARGFNHGDMKAAFQEFLKSQPKAVFAPIWATHKVAGDPQVEQISKAFVRLQELRHSADYDLNWDITRPETFAAIASAYGAMATWNLVKGGRPELARLMATVLLLWKNLQGRQ